MTRAVLRATSALSLFLLVACQAILQADAPAPPSADNKCGGGWWECERPSVCCPVGHTCGGDPDAVGCPPGYCCYIGTGAAQDGGKATLVVDVPQRPVTR